MPRTLKPINEKLYGMLHSNGFDPTPLDASGDDSGVPAEADVFQVVTKNGSPVTVTITSDRIMKLYYNSKATEDEGWYAPDGLLRKLRDFSRQHRLQGFEPEEQNDGKKLKYDMAKRSKMKQEELNLNEGYHAMNKRSSYNDSIPAVKIVIQHSRQIEEGEQRFRNVEKIFIENVEGERFRSPTNSPGLSKIFARLIAEGDKPHGEHWNHLVSLVEDYTKLRGFVRATKSGVFNENAQKWVQAGLNRYTELRESLKSLMSSRGYRGYFENWTPTLNEGSEDTGLDLTEMFKSNVLDSRVEAALPVIKRLSVGLSEDTNLASSLEEWAGKIERDAVFGVEGDKVLEEGCDCGPDCDCPDCKEHNNEVKEDELTSKQKRLDKNKNNRLDREDFKMMRGGVKEEGATPITSKSAKSSKTVKGVYGDDPRIKFGKDAARDMKDVDEGLGDPFGGQQLSNVPIQTQVKSAQHPGQKKTVPSKNPEPVKKKPVTPFKADSKKDDEKVEESYGEQGSYPYGRGIKRGDFVKDSKGSTYRVFGVHGSVLTVKPYSNNQFGEQKDIQLASVKRIQNPSDYKVASEGKLTPGQKRAGQVGSTEKAKSTGKILGQPEKKHPFQGRLVGADESVEPRTTADELTEIIRLTGIKP